MLVSQSTHEQEQNDDHNTNCTENEGNMVLQASTPRDDSIKQTTTQMPPLVINVPPSSPQRRDLERISELEDLFYLGWDSDGLLGPFWGAVDAEGEQDFDEDALDTPQIPDATEDRGDLDYTGDKIVVTADDVKGMNLKTLKDELKKR